MIQYLYNFILEIMGLYGIGKGLFKMAKGVITGDAEEIAKGGKR